MLRYIGRRLGMMVITLFAISIISFIVIQLPPGDFLSAMMERLEQSGYQRDQATIDMLTKRYGLDQPVYMQYIKWMTGMFRGDFGQSFYYNRPVGELIWERLGLTLAVSLAALVFTWVVSLPVGIYSAVKQYSLGDYAFTFLGFVGIGIPSFMLAIILMWLAFSLFGANVGGLFSAKFNDAPWTWAKVVDLIKHLWLPMVVLGVSGTAGLIRVLRAQLLDEIRKPYVVTARAKGLTEGRLLIKYPLRVALNPFISTIGWMLPGLVGGEVIVSMVLGLPTTGPVLYRALMVQDMYLAGTFIMMLSVLTVIGMLISDLLLAWVDPRIRLG